MSIADELNLPEDIKVTYNEEEMPSNLNSWWRNYDLTPEHKQQAQRIQIWEMFKDSVIRNMERIVTLGGGIGGMAITHSDLHVIFYIPPLKGYFSERGKQSMLRHLEKMYDEIKREIEDA